MAAACPGVDSQVLSDHFRGQTACRKLKHCDMVTIETSETSTFCVQIRQLSVVATAEMPVLATEKRSAVETRPMTSVETRQMSSVETTQMSAVPESSGFAWAWGADGR